MAAIILNNYIAPLGALGAVIDRTVNHKVSMPCSFRFHLLRYRTGCATRITLCASPCFDTGQAELHALRYTLYASPYFDTGQAAQYALRYALYAMRFRLLRYRTGCATRITLCAKRNTLPLASIQDRLSYTHYAMRYALHAIRYAPPRFEEGPAILLPWSILW